MLAPFDFLGSEDVEEDDAGASEKQDQWFHEVEEKNDDR